MWMDGGFRRGFSNREEQIERSRENTVRGKIETLKREKNIFGM